MFYEASLFTPCQSSYSSEGESLRVMNNNILQGPVSKKGLNLGLSYSD